MNRKFIFCTAFSLAACLSVAQAAETITLDLSKPINPKTFVFGTNDVWTETYNAEDYTYFEVQNFMFSHLPSADNYGGTSWEGFTVARISSDTLNSFGCMAQGGFDGVGKPYLVGYYSEYYTGTNGNGDPSSNMILFNDGNTYDAVGVYVCNNSNTYHSILNGDSYAKKFAQGDTLVLKIHALDESYAIDDSKQNVVVYLADCRSSDASAWKINKGWEWIDLSALGNVSGLAFTMASSDVSYGFMNTPAYFCLDKLTVREGAGEVVALSEVSTAALEICMRAGYIEVVNATAPIEIYTISGMRVLTTTETIICTTNWPKGVYIVKCNDRIQKIVL
ncbi:MAG: DUF4465 domain-containing protein [Bacteroidales bacterium]|nr:DUF4465 domain-containing protein [Bacteroidales bacterium]